jgi:hypothetical protein
VEEALPAYWRLISVLFSSFPLTSALAHRLYRTAYELYRTDGGVASLDGDSEVIVSGELRNLNREVALGTFAGPAFEAHVETERGKGVVRFVVTHQGIELMAERTARPAN